MDRKYGGGRGNDRERGGIQSYDSGKRDIRKRVQKKGWEEWRQGMETKSSLEWYRAKEVPRRELFLDGNQGSSLLFKARSKSLEVNSRVYRWGNEGSKQCRMCDGGQDETVEHMFLECPRYVSERREMMSAVTREVGMERWAAIQGEGTDRMMEVLLGLSCGNEWNSATAENVKRFLEKVWGKRKGE